MLIENKEQYRANLSSIGDAVLSMDAFGMKAAPSAREFLKLWRSLVKIQMNLQLFQ